jgi:hypothetical protein
MGSTYSLSGNGGSQFKKYKDRVPLGFLSVMLQRKVLNCGAIIIKNIFYQTLTFFFHTILEPTELRSSVISIRSLEQTWLAILFLLVLSASSSYFCLAQKLLPCCHSPAKKQRLLIQLYEIAYRRHWLCWLPSLSPAL